jgi:GNAT superfamily N-acetyltransferase
MKGWKDSLRAIHPSTLVCLRYLLRVTTVRPYEDRDQTAVVEAVRTVFGEYGFIWEPEGYNSDLYNVPREYQNESAEFFVGEVDGEVVGCGGVLFFPPIPGELGGLTEEEYPRVCGADCEVVRVYVHPRGRRRGVGTAIFERVMTAARERGCKVMEIWSDRLLLDAHRMYERYGAVRVGTRICPPPDKTPEFGMYLQL